MCTIACRDPANSDTGIRTFITSIFMKSNTNLTIVEVGFSAPSPAVLNCLCRSSAILESTQTQPRVLDV